MIKPKIVLINPPSNFLIDEKVFPPLGILYLSSYLKKYGYDPEIIDLAGEKEIPEITADIIGVTSTTPQFPSAQEILKELKYNRQIEAQYVIGGPHATCSPNICMEYPSFDTAVLGEGEISMLSLVQKYPLNISEISSDVISDIDDIPFPDRGAIDIHSYKYFIDDKPATTMITSRGCPYSCAFCSTVWGKKVRMHSASYVINEIKEIQKLGFQGIMFFDDILILNKKRLLNICEYLKKENIVWRCFARANIASREAFQVMAESGCKEVGVGIESGSQKILDTINKCTTVEQNRNVIKLAKECGIRIKVFIIVGLPGETRETIAETEKFLEETQPDDLDVTIYCPYPNTPIVNNPEMYDIKFNNNDLRKAWFKGHPGEYSSIVSTNALSAEEIVAARERIEKRFKRWQ